MAALAVFWPSLWGNVGLCTLKKKSHSIQIIYVYNAFLILIFFFWFCQYLFVPLWDLWDQLLVILFDCDQWANVLCVWCKDDFSISIFQTCSILFIVCKCHSEYWNHGEIFKCWKDDLFQIWFFIMCLDDDCIQLCILCLLNVCLPF